MASRQLIGMVHALPLPGPASHRPPVGAIVERAVEDAILLEAAGFDAVLVENYGDAPFFADRVPPVTVASMARAASRPPRPAGIMASSMGRATVAPMPFRKMRRGMCLPVISLIVFSLGPAM